MFVELITQYGYVGLFGLLMFGIVGVPVPEELLLFCAGTLASSGKMNLPFTICAGALGAMCGITASYTIGRFIGLPAIHKFGRFLHITDENLRNIHDWFERWGKWTLVFGYFVPAVRHLSAIVAGTSKLPLHEFAVFAYGGALIWANIFVLAGFFLGPQALKIVPVLHRDLMLISTATIVSVTIVLLVRRWIVKRRGKITN